MSILPHRTHRGQFQRSKYQRGQSIVVALLVLLLLGLLGGLFTAIVARNLVNARHANRVLTADNYSKAGIAFADAQLTYSLDGADWRPPLQAPLANPPTETREMLRYNAAAASLTTLNPADPDAKYLAAGFTRYNTGNGRFLLRLTYSPVTLKDSSGNYYDPVFGSTAPIGVPPGRYIKIEAVGREGVIDPTDPTSFANNLSTDRTQSFQVAYKPIGITDYARFETNPDKRSDVANLGVVSQFYSDDTDGGIATPGAYDFTGSGSAYQLYPVITTYGAADAYLRQTAAPYNVTPNPTAGTGQPVPYGFTPEPGGGSSRANMTARYYGKNIFYMYNSGADFPSYQDTMEIAGDLLLDNYDPTIPLDNSGTHNPVTAGQQAALILNPKALNTLTTTGTFIAPSSAPAPKSFDTQGGLIRDGSTKNDVNGLPRGITRLEPPVMDGVDPATTLPRYKALAMMSAPRPDPAASPAASYPTNSGQYGYGKIIYIDNTADLQTESQAIGGGTTLTDEWLHQSAPNSASAPSIGGWHGHLYDPPGVNITLGDLVKDSGGSLLPGIHMVRSDGNWKNPANGSGGTSQVLDTSFNDLGASGAAATSNNDIILYAEGNVRLRGILSPMETVNGATTTVPRHITIVTNGTAYIDGNLLKGSPDSSITVLAHEYVCVNTTQFLAGATVQNQLPPLTGNSFEIDDANLLTQVFSFGLPLDSTGAAIKTGSYASPPFLYVSAASDSGNALADFNITGTGAASTTYEFSGISATHYTFSLSALPALGQYDNEQLTIARDPGNNPTDPGNVLLDRVAVLPMDIRIEAVLYAQTRSFFVIPGDWFNTSSNDTLDTFAQSVTATNPNGDPRPFGGDVAANNTNRFPFYGQPIDLKITIDGAVSEARPADISAQTAWMLKWGWIPQYHGSMIGASVEPAGHLGTKMPAIGLQIIYNPQAGYPYNPGATPTASYYLRSDMYGRPLPFSPKLPVSTGLLYSGESSEAPLLQ